MGTSHFTRLTTNALCKLTRAKNEKSIDSHARFEGQNNSETPVKLRKSPEHIN